MQNFFQLQKPMIFELNLYGFMTNLLLGKIYLQKITFKFPFRRIYSLQLIPKSA